MKYALAYNEFHNLESIGIENKTEKLIQYTYKNGNGRLKEMKYANGDTMKATYNSIGQMVAETWFDKSSVEKARYKYVYDGEGNIVRSIDITAKKEYNYEYEEGRIVRATEADIELNGEIVTSKVIVDTVKYYYDSESKMTKKVITFADNSTHTVHYENSDDNTVVKFDVPDTDNANKKQTITSHSKTDSFGRKQFDEIQLGTGFVSRQFSYLPGAITEAHTENKKIKSTATTQLVSHIILSGGRTISYEYDNEERITKVVDSVDGTTTYTYDALGQLLTETTTKNGVTTVVNSMEYDNYGNIKTKNGIAYTYDNTWKDLLLQVGTGDNSTISYDDQGNPLTYLGHTLTWEKGRQLKSFDGNTYTYNANGIRTSKTINGVTHTYTLDGTKILRETWGNNILIPLYDNEDSVCGILYNNVPYYFIKNLQGDVIAIVNKKAETVARYSYDAWGKITSITGSNIDIANINPFRYRSYYYDQEIKLYYLQSRYYDADVGRFVNEDCLEAITCSSCVLENNLFAYCNNDAINETDTHGTVVLKIFEKIIKGVIQGVLKTLCSDFISYLYDYFFVSKNTKFKSSTIKEYLLNIASCVLSSLISFSGVLDTCYKIILLIKEFLPKIVKGIMAVIDWVKMIAQILSIAVSKSISKILDKNQKKKLDALTKKRKKNSKNTGLKIEKKQIKFQYKEKGEKIDFCLEISDYLVMTFLDALVA